MKPITKILNEQDKKLFEKAFKFYFFTKQHEVEKLNSKLQERFYASGQIAYSVIAGYVIENQLRTEFIEFLELEMESLSALNNQMLQPLAIKPEEIESIELKEEQKLTAFDEYFAGNLIISYQPEENEVNLVVCG